MPVRTPLENPCALSEPTFEKLRDAVNPDRIVYQIPLPNGEVGEFHVRSAAVTEMIDSEMRGLAERCSGRAVDVPRLKLQA